MNTIAVSLGDNCVDHYLPPLERRFIGGNALNVAVYMQKAGLTSAYIGAVGQDEAGRQVLQALQEQGVDTSHVRVLSGETSQTDIRLTLEGDRQFIHETPGPSPKLELDANAIQFILRHRLVHNTWMGGSEKYLAEFHRGPVLVSMDYGERYTPDFVERTIKNIDVAFFSTTEELAHQARDLAMQMTQRGPRLVVVTMGKQGSMAYDGNIHTQPAYKVDVVDTLGAGDTFIGTFLADWLYARQVPYCLEQASQAAAHTCTHYGAWQ